MILADGSPMSIRPEGYRCRPAARSQKQGAKGRIKGDQNSTLSGPPELSPHIRLPLGSSSILFPRIPEVRMSLFRLPALLVMCSIALSAVGESATPQNSATAPAAKPDDIPESMADSVSGALHSATVPNSCGDRAPADLCRRVHDAFDCSRTRRYVLIRIGSIFTDASLREV